VLPARFFCRTDRGPCDLNSPQVNGLGISTCGAGSKT